MQSLSNPSFPRPYQAKFDIDTGEIDPESEHTEEITLPSSDFKFGIIKGHQPHDTACLRGHFVWIMFTTDINFSNSFSPDKKTYSLYGYLFDAWHTKGYDYEDDTKLSPNEFYGAVAGGSWKSYLKSCYIDGDKLKLTWYNPGTANKSRAYFRGAYIVWR